METINNLPEVVNLDNNGISLEKKDKESYYQHSMFEYYTKVYTENPAIKGHHHYKMVADHFNKDIGQILQTAKKFSWRARARKALVEMKTVGTEELPVEATNLIKDMVINTHLIAKLGTKLISDYLVNVNPKLLLPKDVFKLGMLVVECVRVTNEVTGGNVSQQQGQTINLVINDG